MAPLGWRAAAGPCPARSAGLAAPTAPMSVAPEKRPREREGLGGHRAQTSNDRAVKRKPPLSVSPAASCWRSRSQPSGYRNRSAEVSTIDTSRLYAGRRPRRLAVRRGRVGVASRPRPGRSADACGPGDPRFGREPHDRRRQQGHFPASVGRIADQLGQRDPRQPALESLDEREAARERRSEVRRPADRVGLKQVVRDAPGRARAHERARRGSSRRR